MVCPFAQLVQFGPVMDQVIVFLDLVPIDDIPPGVYVIAASVLVGRRVAMLPNIQTQPLPKRRPLSQ